VSQKGEKKSFDAKSPTPKKVPSKLHHPYPKLICVPKRFGIFHFRKEKEEAKDFAPPI
jgi:hypothetical protein